MQFRLSRPVYAVIVLVVIPSLILYALRAVESGSWSENGGGFWAAAIAALVFIFASLARIADMHVKYLRAAGLLFVGTLFFPPMGFVSLPCFLYFWGSAPKGESVRDLSRHELTIEYR